MSVSSPKLLSSPKWKFVIQFSEVGFSWSIVNRFSSLFPGTTNKLLDVYYAGPRPNVLLPFRLWLVFCFRNLVNLQEVWAARWANQRRVLILLIVLAPRSGQALVTGIPMAIFTTLATRRYSVSKPARFILFQVLYFHLVTLHSLLKFKPMLNSYLHEFKLEISPLVCQSFCLLLIVAKIVIPQSCNFLASIYTKHVWVWIGWDVFSVNKKH